MANTSLTRFNTFKRIKDPIEGTALVMSATPAPSSRRSAVCELHLVVVVPGHAPFSADVTVIAKRSHWPAPGTTVRVTASMTDPIHLSFRWPERSVTVSSLRPTLVAA